MAIPSEVRSNLGIVVSESDAVRTNAAYRREIEEADDPTARRTEIEQRLQELSSPMRTAHAFDVEEIIDPRDTRPLLAEFVAEAQPRLETQLGPTAGLSYVP